MTTTSADSHERVLRVGGTRIRVRIRGEGEPVLLINGLGANVAMWNSLAEQLTGFQVISYDAAGTGHSSTPLLPYTMAHTADVASGVLDALGHDRAHVLGYSFGGAVAQTLALREPDRIHRLVLACTSCGVGAVPGSMRALLAVMTPMRYYSKRAHELAAAMVELAPAERNSSFLERTAAERKEAMPSMLGYALQMTAFWTFSSVRWLHRIETPALVLAGTNDKLVPAANAALLAAYLPNARLRLYEQWGHYVLHDARSGAGAAVADFFSADRPEDSGAWRDALAITGENLAGFVRAAPTVHPAAIVSLLVRRAFPPPRRGSPE